MHKFNFELTGTDFGFIDYQAVFEFPDSNHQMIITATWDVDRNIGHIVSYVTDENGREFGYVDIHKNLSLYQFTDIVAHNPLEQN